MLVQCPCGGTLDLPDVGSILIDPAKLIVVVCDELVLALEPDGHIGCREKLTNVRASGVAERLSVEQRRAADVGAAAIAEYRAGGLRAESEIDFFERVKREGGLISILKLSDDPADAAPATPEPRSPWGAFPAMPPAKRHRSARRRG